MEERFKPIMGYNGRYEISNLGRVRSVRKNMFLSVTMSTISDCPKVMLRMGGKMRTHLIKYLLINHFPEENQELIEQVEREEIEKLKERIEFEISMNRFSHRDKIDEPEIDVQEKAKQLYENAKKRREKALQLSEKYLQEQKNVSVHEKEKTRKIDETLEFIKALKNKQKQ